VTLFSFEESPLIKEYGTVYGVEGPPTLPYVPVILLHEKNLCYVRVKSSVADPGSGAFLTTGSGIQDLESGIGFFQDPGSQTHIFENLASMWLQKKVGQQIFSPSSFVAVVRSRM
jgi:hypothetical protein